MSRNRLDAHRKRQQALFPHLTLTGIYNVLEKLRSGEALNANAEQIHDDGLVILLRQIHQEIDFAGLLAYGWDDLNTFYGGAYDPWGTKDCGEAFEENILTRLVALNHERAAEEKRGLVRWLRPEYRNPDSGVAKLVRLSTDSPDDDECHTTFATPPPPVAKLVRVSTAPPSTTTLPWPDKLPEQVARIRALVTELGSDPTALSARFGRTNKKREDQIAAILETLRGLGL